MNIAQKIIALAMGYLIGYTMYMNPFPAELANFIVAVIAGIGVYKEFRKLFLEDNKDPKKEEDESKID
jgi:hypothetical protein